MATWDLAYWVKGKKILPVTSNHIDYILQHLDTFNLTQEQVEAYHKKHDEPLGFEGYAREEIIKEVAKEGWIRVRHYIRPRDYWSIQTNDVEKQKPQIEDFILSLLQNKKISMNDEIQLYSYKKDEQKNYTFQMGGVRAFLTEAFIRIDSKLLEYSLNSFVEDSRKYDIGMVTAFKSENSKKENLMLNKRLFDNLSKFDYTLIKALGTSDEGGVLSKENSYLVIDKHNQGTLEEDLIKVGTYLDQYSVLFIPKGGDKAYLINTKKGSKTYGKRTLFSNRRLGVTGKYLTYIGGRPFYYESIDFLNREEKLED